MEKQSLRAERIELTDPQLYSALVDFLINIGEQVFAVSRKFSSQRKMLAFDGEEWIGDCDNPTITDVQFLEKYKGPKTRKPGVKYTLEDWKKEADAARKRKEYWQVKFQNQESSYKKMKLESKQLKAFNDELKSEKDFIDSDRNDVRHTLKKLQLDLDTTNKNYLILQTENKVLKEGNENLRNSNDELLKSSTEASQEIGFAKLKIQDLEKERDETAEELKTVKSHLELRIKGIQALEHDAKLNRIEIASLKSDFETKNAELEILEEDYNCLKDVQKYTKVVGWAGWILFFIALFGLMFFKG